MFCIDLTNPNSVAYAEEKIQRYCLVKDVADGDSCGVLVGTKCDLVDDIKVTESDIQPLQMKYRYPYIETSALKNVNVEKAFETCVHELKRERDTHEQLQKREKKGGACIIL
jgi:GTPase SAR1 family protein